MSKNHGLEIEPLRQRLPPATSLITFESAARLGSFTAAAEELRVTQAAVSRQVKRIEEFVGQALFVPAGRGKVLSPAGRVLLRSATQALGHIARSITQVKADGARRCFSLHAPLSFVNLWLLPRFASFRHAHPDVDVRFITGDVALELPEATDALSIRFGDGKWPHLNVHPLLDLEVFPVCSPAYLVELGMSCDDKETLLRGTLLDHGKGETLPVQWDSWFSQNRMAPPGESRRLTFTHYDGVVQAALLGHGIALGVDRLLQVPLRQQGLVRLPAPPAMPLRCHLVMPHSLETSPAMSAFAAWITNESDRPLEKL
ncbi:LysR substrate-binding domain-containing protein [Paraburkholderia sp. EG285A]|uniref:LysR substrate-binding domain-containing protein n=1 Tax=Paraburkholderia sp. EG285A TaxID=3237009 RepID=UPI0034D35B34